MAMAERHLNAVFGDEIVDHKTWVIAGDGCLMEGINHEAIGLAGHLGLGRLIVLWDDNRITIDGATELSTSEDVKARHTAAGWHVTSCDGLDAADIRRAIDEAIADPRPSLVACRTIIGFGSPGKQGTAGSHGSPLGASEIEKARVSLNWPFPPFTVPAPIAEAWTVAGQRAVHLHNEWQERLDNSQKKQDFLAALSGDVTATANAATAEHIQTLLAKPANVATRKASEMALDGLTAALPTMIGGSADLTGSNNTRTPATTPFNRDHYAGRYVSYGIREFGMAAAMNGMALHGGIIPYGGTFLVFADYCRAAIRLSAIQQVRTIYVMTHDSIGLGEDGPTHQPIEQLQSLRAMPNLDVYRPADAVETAECWALALAKQGGPAVLALSRQNLPQLRHAAGMLSARGAYRMHETTLDRRVVLIATGSEVALALDVAEALAAKGIGADVVSMPCTELFDAQDAAYRADMLGGKNVLRVSIEAGSTFGWERYVGLDGLAIGIDSFGASAPIDALYQHFGLTVDAIVPRIEAKLSADGDA